jgi:hypothetical protein
VSVAFLLYYLCYLTALNFSQVRGGKEHMPLDVIGLGLAAWKHLAMNKLTKGFHM